MDLNIEVQVINCLFIHDAQLIKDLMICSLYIIDPVMTFHHIEELGDQGGKSSLHGLNWRQNVRGGW
jgi:hypothetical protein